MSSGPSGACAPPPSDGVIRNSALSFVSQPGAQTQAPQESLQDHDREKNQSDRLMPAGLKALCDIYSALYPDQPNPLQVTTRLKYWLGGSDPLDYISMYWNPGKPEENIPPHWHYVSFGLTDLHGDGRVHYPGPAAAPSGRGAELAVRVRAPAPPPAPPPLWPAALMQAIARYLLVTGNKLCAGDHISWHSALDGGASRVRHLLVANEPQLTPANTPHGTVSFLQLVGCTGRELRAAQRGSGFEVLQALSQDARCGPWLVTDVTRRRSARVRARPAPAPVRPAHLAGVSAKFAYTYWTPHQSPLDERPSPAPSPAAGQLSPRLEDQIKETLQRGLTTMAADRTGQEGHTGMSTDSFQMSSIERALPHIPDLTQSWRSEDEDLEYLDGVHLIMTPEAASLLPLAVDGRVLAGGHFTWRWGGSAVTLLSPRVTGARVTLARPYVTHHRWLQILIPKELAEDMSNQVSKLSRLAETDSETDSGGSDDSGDRNKESIVLPFTLEWPKYKLKISVVPDNEFL